MTFTITGSRPAALAALNAKERALFERFPDDFRAFYERHNGGLCDGDVQFDTPTHRYYPDGQVRTVNPAMLYELWSFMRRAVIPAKGRPQSILREHSGRHVGEQFLPRNVIVFGSTEQNSLLAISLNAHDFGEIYYWEWYWQYPWFKSYFHARVVDAKRRFAEDRTDLAGRTLAPDLREDDALDYATLVPIAPSFAAFVKSLKAPT